MRIFAICVLTLLLATATLVVAQPQANPTASNIIPAGAENKVGGTYTFCTGDGKVRYPWALLGPDWSAAAEHPRNDKFREEGRQSKRNGMTIFRDYCGETFYVPAPYKAKADLVADGPIVTPVSTDPPRDAKNAGDGGKGKNPVPTPPDPGLNVGFSILILILAALIWYLLGLLIKRKNVQIAAARKELEREREANREANRHRPVEGGPPMVPGGLDMVAPRMRYTVAASFFREFAAQQAPGTTANEWVVDGNLVRGLFNSGERLIPVQYQGGAREDRYLADTPGVRADMRHVSGRTETWDLLWGCLNGLWRGRVGGQEGVDYTFTPSTDIHGETEVLRPNEPTRREIADLAYSLWESRGGNAEQNWLEAERILRGQQADPAPQARAARV